MPSSPSIRNPVKYGSVDLAMRCTYPAWFTDYDGLQGVLHVRRVDQGSGVKFRLLHTLAGWW